MFDIGMFEMFVIVVLAIIVVGPRDLPKMLRTAGQMVRKIKALGQEFQTGIKQIADEVELEEVTRKLNEAGNIPMENVERRPDITDDDLDGQDAETPASSPSDDVSGEEVGQLESDKAKGTTP
ncbi:Sec-independent protein translocase protein TatB [Emcibacter sp.]|uniref:Sec-independent protein translocase protein TatB n=1 Tax=Emcibacter sp. TaxID=1979954 RepID=UPI003A9264D5